MKKIIFYQSWFNQIGGVETMAYNWCYWMRNYFDILVLYSGGDNKRLIEMAKLVKIERIDENKEYECDIFIRNSVWGIVPRNIKAKKEIELRHANYKYLLDNGTLYQQYKDMGIKNIVGCGDFVSEMSNLVLHDNPTTIKNILYPKRETHKVIKLISCTRLDAEKGWNRMLKMASMMRDAKIKFEWNIFTNSQQECPYEEIHFWKQRYDIWDYLVDADYTVLLSDSEGLPYTVQESLQYQVPCIVTDIGGCTELIKDGINGYVVPLDMNFDIKKILNIPKCEEYNNHALEDWLKYLEYDGRIDIKINEEERKMKARVIATMNFTDLEEIDEEGNNVERIANESEWVCSLERLEYLVNHNAVKILEFIEEPKEEQQEELLEEENDDVVIDNNEENQDEALEEIQDEEPKEEQEDETLEEIQKEELEEDAKEENESQEKKSSKKKK